MRGDRWAAVRKLLVAGLRIALGIDVSLGVLVYSVASLAGGRGFDGAALAVALVAALAPDLDLLPFLVLRRRLGLQSHRRLGHHPLLAVPLAAALAAAAGGWLRPADRAFWGLLAASAVAAHYLHDAVHPVGLHLLSPFSWAHFRLGARGLERVPEAEVHGFFARKARQPEGREGWIDQVASRLAPAGRAEGLWLAAALLSLLAVVV